MSPVSTARTRAVETSPELPCVDAGEECAGPVVDFRATGQRRADVRRHTMQQAVVVLEVVGGDGQLAVGDVPELESSVSGRGTAPDCDELIRADPFAVKTFCTLSQPGPAA